MNKRKILRVLRKAPLLIMGTFQRKNRSDRCAIGELLHAAGEQNLANTSYPTNLQFKLLDKMYDLGGTAVDFIIKFNDCAGDSLFAPQCSFKNNGKGAQKRRDKARVCVVIKEIQRMKS